MFPSCQGQMKTLEQSCSHPLTATFWIEALNYPLHFYLNHQYLSFPKGMALASSPEHTVLVHGTSHSEMISLDAQ